MRGDTKASGARYRMWRSTLFWHQKLMRGFIERHKPRNRQVGLPGTDE
jgi:hypothetical protein